MLYLNDEPLCRTCFRLYLLQVKRNRFPNVCKRRLLRISLAEAPGQF